MQGVEPVPGRMELGMLGGVLCLALALRLHHLGALNYWFDEAIALFSARDAAFAADFEMAPPLYFLLLRAWMFVWGDSEAATRSLSLLFSLGSVGALYGLGRRFFSAGAGLWAAFFLAVSPFAIYYAQETRPYSLFLFLSLCSTWALLEAVFFKRSLAPYVLASALMGYTLYIGFVVLLVQGVALAWFGFRAGRKDCLRWLLAALAVLALFSPWAGTFLRHWHRIGGGWWIHPPETQRVWVSLGTFLLGFNATRDLYLLALAAGAGCLAGYRAAPVPWGALPPVLCVLGWLVVYAVSRFGPVSVYHERTLLFLLPYVLLCLALCMRIRTVRILFLVFYLPAVGVSLAQYYANAYPYDPPRSGIYPRKPVAAAVERVARGFRAGDAVLHTAASITFPFRWYALRQGGNPALQTFCRENGCRDLAVSRGTTDEFCLQYREAAARYPRIWLVQTWWEPSSDFDPENEKVKQLLMEREGYRLVSETDEGDIRISLLSREGAADAGAKPSLAGARP